MVLTYVDIGVAAFRAKDRDLAIWCETIDRVGVWVAEQQIAIGMPDRSFRELEPRRDALDRSAWRDDGIQCGIESHEGAPRDARQRSDPFRVHLDRGRPNPDEVGRRI